MKNTEVVDNLSDVYFPFSFYLLEDELQALQLVVDVTTAIMIESKEVLGEMHKLENRVLTYKKLYELALKRKLQINLSEEEISLKEKTAFYLSENIGLQHQMIALLLEVEEIELKQLISSARFKVFSRERRISQEVSRAN